MSRRRHTAFALVLTALALPARAEGPYDGAWVGTIETETGRCPTVRKLELRIAEGRITGATVGSRRKLTVSSVVTPEGKVGPNFASSGATAIRVRSGRMTSDAAKLGWDGQPEEPSKVGSGQSCIGTINLERVRP